MTRHKLLQKASFFLLLLASLPVHATQLQSWSSLTEALHTSGSINPDNAQLMVSSGGLLEIALLKGSPQVKSDPLGALGPCVLSLVKTCDSCFAAVDESLAVNGEKRNTVTIYFSKDAARSVKELVVDSTTICLSSIEQVVGQYERTRTVKAQTTETAQTVVHWKYVAASLLVDCFFVLLLMSVFFACAKGDDTAEYRYALDEFESEELALTEDWTAPLSQGLVRRKSLISLVSVEDLPTSPRLLYPHKLRRSKHTQSAISSTSTLASVAISEVEEQSPLVDEEQGSEQVNGGTSIFAHPTMTIWWKASVPLLIVVTIGFYLSGQFAGGVLVELQMFIRGKPWISAPISDFDLVTSVQNMLSAKVYPMAIITIVWSGIWPYLRQVLLLFTWFAPTSVFSLQRRAALIHLLDICGKWCLLNLFMSTMMGVAFAFNVSTDTIYILNKLLPKDFLHCTIVIKQQYGTYASIIGTALSLVAGHITIHFHRCTLASDAAADYHFNVKPQRRQEIIRRLSTGAESRSTNFDDESGDRILSDVNSPMIQSTTLSNTPPNIATSWLQYGSTDEYVRESVRAHFRKCCGWKRSLLDELVILLLLPLTVAFLVYGLLGISFSFSFGGLLAKILKVVEPSEVSSNHSIVSIIMASGKADDIGAKSVQGFLLLVTVIFPFVHMLLLAVLWFIPLTLRKQKLVYMLQEMCAAWVSVDVFLLSIVSSVLQISKFTEWMVGKNCPHKIHCFAVDSTFEPDAWTVFVAVFLWYTVDYLINKKADHAILHRERLVESLVDTEI